MHAVSVASSPTEMAIPNPLMSIANTSSGRQLKAKDYYEKKKPLRCLSVINRALLDPIRHHPRGKCMTQLLEYDADTNVIDIMKQEPQFLNSSQLLYSTWTQRAGKHQSRAWARCTQVRSSSLTAGNKRVHVFSCG